jgi:photosystem II stability/assembly factor-like uncharacterized protein
VQSENTRIADAPIAPPPPSADIAGIPAAARPNEARAKALARTDGTHLGTRAVAGSLLARQARTPSWTVTAAGAVQRSYDGRSWQTVVISPGTTFRAVAAAANDVWAGDSTGALYHSTDSGDHWQRVEVSSAGRELHGAIASIDAARPPAVTVITTLGERWTTSDGGQIWKPE